MNSLDQLLTGIARNHFGYSTLKTRNSDSLDFRNVAVWQVKMALAAAFEAGNNTSRPAKEPDPRSPKRFDNYEIQPCRRYLDADEPDIAFVEPCAAFEAHFWTLYGHIPGEGVQAIGDFDTRQHAEEVFARITGSSYE